MMTTTKTDEACFFLAGPGAWLHAGWVARWLGYVPGYVLASHCSIVHLAWVVPSHSCTWAGSHLELVHTRHCAAGLAKEGSSWAELGKGRSSVWGERERREDAGERIKRDF